MYIDERGVEMEDMSFGRAMEIVAELARLGLPTETNGVPGDLIARQKTAVDMFEDYVVNHYEVTDEKFPLPERFSDTSLAPISKDDVPDKSIVACMRYALELAQGGGIDIKETERNPGLADMYDRQQQAFELVGHLITTHGPEIESGLYIVPVFDEAQKDAGKTYPAERWLRVQFVMQSPQLAYAPDPLEDPLQAYSSSLFLTEEAAKADIARYVEGMREAREREGEEFDAEDEAEEEGYARCVVNADGSIDIPDYGRTLTRDRLFNDFGVVDPFANDTPSP